MIQIRKEENQKNQKNQKNKTLNVYKVNTRKKTVAALWVLLAVSFLFAVYKNFTAIDIHTVHETKVIEEKNPRHPQDRKFCGGFRRSLLFMGTVCRFH